jgi:uncharacterized protein
LARGLTNNGRPKTKECEEPTTNDIGHAKLYLQAGQKVTVVKLNPNGQEVARYPAAVRADASPAPWFSVEARWVMKRMEVCGLAFVPGDTLIEYFSTDHWFNAFRVLAPDGAERGTYGNVTHPVSIAVVDDEVVVTWHDLYLDVIRLDDGTVLLCDEDELEESGLAVSDPGIYARVRTAGKDMIALATSAVFPFDSQSG